MMLYIPFHTIEIINHKYYVFMFQLYFWLNLLLHFVQQLCRVSNHKITDAI